MFADRVDLGSNTFITTAGDNSNATKEDGENLCHGSASPCVRSVWRKWTAPLTGSVEMNTFGWTDAEDTYRFKGHAHPDLDTIYRWVFEDLGAAAQRSFHKHWTQMIWHPEQNPTDDAAEVSLAKHFKETHGHAIGYHVDKGWLQALDHFAECMLTGEKPDTANARDGFIAELMGEAAVASRKSGMPENFDKYAAALG